MTAHRVWLTLHQWLGLAGAIFILIMTGVLIWWNSQKPSRESRPAV